MTTSTTTSTTSSATIITTSKTTSGQHNVQLEHQRARQGHDDNKRDQHGNGRENPLTMSTATSTHDEYGNVFDDAHDEHNTGHVEAE